MVCEVRKCGTSDIQISNRKMAILIAYFLMHRMMVIVDFFVRMGLKRNLSAAEIVEQAVYARRLLSHEVGNITNVVFMVSLYN